jgi:hypothetical protein
MVGREYLCWDISTPTIPKFFFGDIRASLFQGDSLVWADLSPLPHYTVRRTHTQQQRLGKIYRSTTYSLCSLPSIGFYGIFNASDVVCTGFGRVLRRFCCMGVAVGIVVEGFRIEGGGFWWGAQRKYQLLQSMCSVPHTTPSPSSTDVGSLRGQPGFDFPAVLVVVFSSLPATQSRPRPHSYPYRPEPPFFTLCPPHYFSIEFLKLLLAPRSS